MRPKLCVRCGNAERDCETLLCVNCRADPRHNREIAAAYNAVGGDHMAQRRWLTEKKGWAGW